jgi:hypothetical protein
VAVPGMNPFKQWSEVRLNLSIKRMNFLGMSVRTFSVVIS